MERVALEVELNLSALKPNRVVRSIQITRLDDAAIRDKQKAVRLSGPSTDGFLDWDANTRMDRIVWLFAKASLRPGQPIGGRQSSGNEAAMTRKIAESWRKTDDAAWLRDLVRKALTSSPPWRIDGETDAIKLGFQVDRITMRDNGAAVSVHDAIVKLETFLECREAKQDGVAKSPADALPERAPVSRASTGHPIFLRGLEQPRSNASFREWVTREVQGELAPCYTPREDGRYGIGACTVLELSSSASGYEAVDCEFPTGVSSCWDPASLDKHDLSMWRQKRDELARKGFAGLKLCVTGFDAQISDHPRLRLYGEIHDFCDAKAFSDLFDSKNPAHEAARARYRPRALAMAGAGATTLNILTTAIIVVLNDAAGVPHLLLARRATRGEGTFDGNTWSVGIGEGFNPAPFNGQPADRSVLDSVVRGLREELGITSKTLGHTLEARICFHGLALEDSHLHPILLATADLRPLTFSTVSSHWLASQDQAEHGALAAIPLDASTLTACLAGPHVPPAVLQRANKAGLVTIGQFKAPSRDEFRDEARVPWQQNSHLRLACGRWFGATLI